MNAERFHLSEMTPPTDMSASIGIYLYALARPACVSILADMAASGLHGVSPQTPVTALTDERAVAQVIALISTVVIADFSEENLQTLSWVGARAAQHEAVVALAMTAATVLPVKFGTIFRSVESLQKFMATHVAAIDQALDTLSDKAEWSVKAYLVEAEVRHLIAAQEPTIVQRRAALSDAPGARYMQQKQIDALTDTAVDKALAQASQALLQALQSRAEASRALRCHASAVTGRAERMIFNGSFLLSAQDLPDFRDALAEHQAVYQTLGVTLELRGPWPPYNFCPDLAGPAL